MRANLGNTVWYCLLVCLLLPNPATAQNGVPADGTEILRGLLKFHGFKPVTVLNPDLRSTLVVIVGDERIPAAISRRIPDILLAGGGLLVISDGPFKLRPLLPQIANFNTNVAITGLKVHHADAAKCFRGDRLAPIPKLAGADPTLLWMAKRGAPTVLATREPGTISLFRNSLMNIEMLYHAENAHYAGENLFKVNQGAPLGVMSDPNLPGVAIAIASRTLFTNDSMVATDANGNRTDNFLYSFLLTRLIAERLKPNGAPLECLFVEDRSINNDFDRVGFVERPEMNLPPGVPPVLPPLPVLLDFVLDKGNDLVAQAEDRDIPNVIQQRDTNNRFQEAVLSGLAIIGSIILLRYLLARGWGARHTPELAPRMRIDPDRGGFIPERRYALLESGNLYEPMRDHLRWIFKKWISSKELPTSLPVVRPDRPNRPVKRIVADLSRLWQIAYSSERVTIAPDELEDLEDMISELGQAHDAGIWRFVTEETK